MLIEVAGVPGAGKTTLCHALSQRMADAQMVFRSVKHYGGQTPAGHHTPRFVVNNPEAALLHRYIRFTRQNPELERLWTEAFEEAPVRHLLFSMMAGYYQSAVDLAPFDELVFQDEGFLTYAVAIFYESGSISDVTRFMEAAPSVDAVIYMHSTADLAFQRAIDRGDGSARSRRGTIRKHGDFETFERRVAMTDAAVAVCEARRVPVIRLNAESDPDELCDSLLPQLRSLLDEAIVRDLAGDPRDAVDAA